MAADVRQRLPPHEHCCDANRKVDHEQPRPRSDAEYDGGKRRARCRRHRQDESIVTDPPPQHLRRIGRANQRGIHAHDACGTDSLEHASEDQSGEAMRESARDGPDREQREPRDINAPIAETIAQGSQRKQQDRDRQLVGVDYPHRRRRGRAEVLRDRRQRHVRDRPVEHRHGKRQPDRGRRPITARDWKAVFALRGRDFRLRDVHSGGIIGTAQRSNSIALCKARGEGEHPGAAHDARISQGRRLARPSRSIAIYSSSKPIVSRTT